jgi:hypothetical protein
MARKPNETLWRLLVVLLIEMMRHMRLPQKRFYEETGGNARIGELTYICSQQVHD